MADAALVIGGRCVTVHDDRFDYNEPRFLTVGFLGQRMMIVVWTPRGDICRVISMRKANDREIARYEPVFGAADG